MLYASSVALTVKKELLKDACAWILSANFQPSVFPHKVFLLHQIGHTSSVNTTSELVGIERGWGLHHGQMNQVFCSTFTI